MTAQELIRQALRLISVPGRGALLVDEDYEIGFDALKAIIDSEATTEMFIPGRKLHFYNLPMGQTEFSYGQGPQADLRSDAFNDPMPMRVNKAWSSSGETITSNEILNNYDFSSPTGWLFTAGGQLSNNVAELRDSATVFQNVPLVIGKNYTLRFDIIVNVGSVQVRIQDTPDVYFSKDLTGSGTYEYDYTHTEGADPQVMALTENGSSADVHMLSILERGKQRMEIHGGSRREVDVDYSRNYALGKLCVPANVSTIVMEVLTNQAYITNMFATLHLNPEATLWLTYRLAHVVSRAFSKKLDTDQKQIMKEAWSNMAGVNLNVEPMKADGSWGAVSSRRR